jgi:hypothetical protein
VSNPTINTLWRTKELTPRPRMNAIFGVGIAAGPGGRPART